MNSLDIGQVLNYVNQNIVLFHQKKQKSLEDLSLNKLLEKNPYLFKAKNITTASELIALQLDALLSSSEEKIFGDFLEGLAVFIAQQTCGGHKSAATGVDLEFFNHGIHYVVSIKSGTKWGNSSQHKKLVEDLQKAETIVKQSTLGTNVQQVLGICYGKTKTRYVKGYLKVVGQNFWHLISENKALYTDIIEPIGHMAQEHNEKFKQEKSKVINLLSKEFLENYCEVDGAIDWTKLVEFNSGNYDLDKFLPEN